MYSYLGLGRFPEEKKKGKKVDAKSGGNKACLEMLK